MQLGLAFTSGLIGFIRRLAGTNITTSGESLSENTSILFVANHFTRFETFVIPHIIYKTHKRSSRSLADDGVFVGFLGKYMKWAGALSNKNESRDCIIVEGLLSGKNDWVIYPEGYLVKNKRITFDEGEFCTHSPAYEGPIHTGSAVLALETRILQVRAEEGDHEQLKRFCKGKEINVNKIKLDRNVKIVPVSVTYYPIRPGKNPFLTWVDSKVHQRNSRLFEELEIEANLLMKSHMDIRFGKAIDLDRYIQPLLKDSSKLYNEEFVDKLIDTQRKILTNDMMQKVYSQMQIHFDHLFILSLVTMPTVKVCPSYLKTLIYKNARSLRLLEGFNLHAELTQELYRLILDDKYEPFVSAIELGIAQRILFEDSDGEYLFDRPLLEKEYPFHKVRVKNTLQVILNEIKWQESIVEMAKENSKYTEQELREDNFKHLRQREWEYFEEESLKHKGKSATEGENGAPIILFDAKNDVGVVFSHGYMAAPKELSTLAEYLFSKGINVHVIRLRGHGTDPLALKEVTMQDWETDFERAFVAMRQVCNKVYIGGFSMGGLLALEHASQYKVDGVIVINSALKLHDLRVSYVVPTLHFFNEMISYLNAKGIMEWIDNSKTEQPEVNYPKHPLSSVVQMEKLMTKVARTLRNITAPILIIQGDNDPVVRRKSAQLIYDGVKSKDKKLLILPRKNHSILADDRCIEIFEAVGGFMI